MYINDPNRVLHQVAAAMLWLGMDPTDTNALELRQQDITSTMLYLVEEAKNGELRYYDKHIEAVALKGQQAMTQIPCYFFTQQSLVDFAKKKGRRLALLEERTADFNNSRSLSELDRARERITELERDVETLRAKLASALSAKNPESEIDSPTLRRIIEAVEQYPAWRATKPQEPNLKSVLDWQENQQRDKGNGSRVAHVAHHVIAEHFGLKS